MTDPKWWDIIAPDEIQNENGIRNFFMEYGERWAIAHEIGMSGYQHLQNRVVLKKGMDKWSVIDELQARGVGGCEVQPTHVRDFNYCLKDGIYERESDQVILDKCRGTPRKWQEIAINKFQQQDNRKILLVYDPIGNSGKSWLWYRLVGTHQARGIPAFEDGRDAVRCAMAEDSRGFAIDTPRSGEIKKSLWAGIEQIKNGYLYDDRYQWREKHIPIPRVIVFSNKLPTGKELSADRWEILAINNV